MEKEKDTTEKITAGIILFRKSPYLEVLVVHTGGPYYVGKDERAWSFPKGVINPGENLLEAAKREYKEETGFDVPKGDYIEIGSVKRPGKIVHMWAIEGDCDPTKLVSNTCMVEWPPRSGKQIEIPEVDRGEFVSLEEAEKKLYAYLVPLVPMFRKKLLINKPTSIAYQG